MTDTPIIALYYREHDPMKRKMFLDQSIAAGEDEEANAVRKELWELRYGEPSEAGSGTRADGYLALWMAMEYSKDTAGKLFGLKRARKEIEKNLARLKFREMQEKSELHRELLYRECCHKKENGKFTAQTQAALIQLCTYLCIKFDLTEENLIRHYDVTGKICPKYFVEHPDAWETFKKDVGMELKKYRK